MTQDRKEGQGKSNYFSNPETDADFEHWSKCDYWNIEEVAALLMGKDPNTVGWESVRKFVPELGKASKSESEFARKYQKIRELACRAKGHGSLENLVEPADLIKWATEMELEVPTPLARLVKRWRKKRNKADGLVGKTKPCLDDSDYWQGFQGKATSVVEAYPEWRRNFPRKVQKTTDLVDWIRLDFDLKTREAEIIKKVLTDLYSDLN